MLMQKYIDFQTLTFLTLDTECNPFRVSGIAANDLYCLQAWRRLALRFGSPRLAAIFLFAAFYY
jgi:hypothetical protein